MKAIGAKSFYILNIFFLVSGLAQAVHAADNTSEDLIRLNKKYIEIVGSQDSQSGQNSASILAMKYGQVGMSDEDLQNKINKNKITIVLNLAIEKLKKAQAENNPVIKAQYIADARLLENAIRFDGSQIFLQESLEAVRALSSKWSVKKEPGAQHEAVNLLSSSTGRVLTSAEISKAMKNHDDLSKLNPAGNSYFWQPHDDISRVDIDKISRGEGMVLYKDIKIKFPEDAVYYYNEVKKSSTKPKIDVYALSSSGNKIEFKFKTGREMHADPTVSALSGALGFPADIAKYQRDVKIILGKTKLESVIKEWESYYSRDKIYHPYIIEKYIKESGVDEKGRNFVVFKEGLLEAKPKDILRAGPWSYEDYNNLRELRGLMVLHIWVNNLDIKEMDNNRVLLKEKKNSKGEKFYDIFQVVTDGGLSFGQIFVGEMPEIFSWDIISKNSKNEVLFNYRTFQNPSIRSKITYSDAKWGSRLIAQLTRAQIAKAVSKGEWPSCMQSILVEKLIQRRNDLVKNFDLLGEVLPSGRKIELLSVHRSEDEIKNEQKCVSRAETKDNYVTDMDFSSQYLMSPVSAGAWNSVLDLSREAISKFSKFSLTPSELGLEKGLISQVIIDYNRDFEKNPNSKSYDDVYLVRDSLEVGFRLGWAYGAFVDRMITRRYTLVYPVRSLKDARTNRGMVVDALLPFHISKGKLPEKYVLITEHYADVRLGARADNYSELVTVGAEVGHSRVLLWRSVLDHKHKDKIRLLRDRSDYSEDLAKAYLRVAFMKWPFLTMASNWGEGQGYGYEFNNQDISSDTYLSERIYKAFTYGDFSELDKYETRFEFKNDFKGSNVDLNLALVMYKRKKHLDKMSVKRIDGITDRSTQYSDFQKQGWVFLDNGEIRKTAVKAFADFTEGQKHVKYSIEAHFLVEDRNTTTAEFENLYLPFINNASADLARPIISFTPSLNYSRNGLWGNTMNYLNIKIYHAGIQKLLNVTNNQFWEALAQHLGISRDELNKKVGDYVNFSDERKGKYGQLAQAYPARNSLTLEEVSFYRHVVKLAKSISGVKKIGQYSEQVKAMSDMIRASVFGVSKMNYNSVLIGFLLKLTGDSNYYLTAGVDVPDSNEIKFIAEQELWGEQGVEQASGSKYMIYAPYDVIDVYYFLDNWF